MPAAPARLPADETERLAELHALCLLDTLPETAYDDLVQLASQICGTSIALVSVVDRDRQWFKARIGLDAVETPRDFAFCAHAIVAEEPVFVVEDATLDARFQENPLVTGYPSIRFYAGVPVSMPTGLPLGTLCVIDTVPKTLDAAQLTALRALGRQAGRLIELRARMKTAENHAAEVARLDAAAAAERKRNAEMLDLVLRGGDLGLWDLHVPSERFSVNEREREMLGYSERDVDSLMWRALVHPDDWPVLNAAIVDHAAKRASFYSCEHRLLHAQGRWVWVLMHGIIAERDSLGAPLRIVGTHMDISSRIVNRLALQRTRDLLQRVGELAKVGGWEFEIGGSQVTWSEQVYRIHEVEPGTIIDIERAISFYTPQSQPLIEAAVGACVQHGIPFDLELATVTARGRPLIVRAQGEAMLEGGKPVRVFGTFQDVTAQKAIEHAAVESQRRLRLITDNLPAMVAYVDAEERYRFVNAYICDRFEIERDTTLGRTMREMRGAAFYAQIAPHVAAALSGQAVSFSYDQALQGQPVRLQSNYVPDIDEQGEVRGFYAMTFDITELYQSQRQLEALARIDTLTGLPNRRHFDERIAEGLNRARRTRRAMGLLFLDIDHFKDINDTLGHAGGDEVLREFARRLNACVRVTDMVARLGGDEFVVLLEAVDGAVELSAIADKIVSSIRPRFAVGGSTLQVTTSLGAVLHSGGDPGAASLIARADAALYRAKHEGRNRHAMA